MLEREFRALAVYPRAASQFLEVAGDGRMHGLVPLRQLVTFCKLSVAKLPELAAALERGRRVGVVVQVGDQWRAVMAPEDCKRLALMLRGVCWYLDDVHEEPDTVSVVVSRPAEPSQLVRALNATLEGTWGLHATGEVLVDIARRAERHFILMTPFIDEDGANRVVELFGATRPSVRRELIVRDGLPMALQKRVRDLSALNVQAFDFRISKEELGHNETFHAKAVCADSSECYVGSSNMTRWSFSYSLELGFHVRGVAAARVAQVLDAVVGISTHLRY